MMFCEMGHNSKQCGRPAVAYYINYHNHIKPLCSGHPAMLQTWERGAAEIGPIGNLLHPDPATAWKQKHGDTEGVMQP